MPIFYFLLVIFLVLLFILLIPVCGILVKYTKKMCRKIFKDEGEK